MTTALLPFLAAHAIYNVPWMPPNGSLHGLRVDRLMYWNLLVLVIIAALGQLWLIFALVRRRSSKRSFSPTVKWVLVAAFIAIYIVMAATAQQLWARSRFAGPALTAMQVEVVGEQFQWYFRYPGPDQTFGATSPYLVNAAAGNPLGIDPRDPHGADDIVSSVLVLPVGREVDLRLRSLDVIHGFFIPGMRIKENTVPGMTLHLHFTPTVKGTYPILCTQVCGMGHSHMQAKLEVVSPARFHAWINKQEQQLREEESGQ